MGGSQLHSSGGGASASSSWGWARGSACALGVVSGNPLCVRNVEALGGELEDDVPLRRLLRGPLVGSVLRPVEGDLVASAPAVVGEEAGDGVLIRVLHALQVRRHVGDVDGVLFLPFLCGGSPRGGGCGVPVEPRPRDVRQVVLEGRPVLGGALAGFVGGLVAPQGVGQVCPRRPLAGRGLRGGIMRAGVRGVACCGLELRRGEVHMLLGVLRWLELQF